MGEEFRRSWVVHGGIGGHHMHSGTWSTRARRARITSWGDRMLIPEATFKTTTLEPNADHLALDGFETRRLAAMNAGGLDRCTLSAVQTGPHPATPQPDAKRASH
jgi:hypothetical protein